MRLFFVSLFSMAMLPISVQAIDWKWLGDSTPVVVNATEAFHSDGSPINLVNISDRLNAELLEDFYAMVPEGESVNPVLLTSVFNNINIKDDLGVGEVVTVKITFLNEGAGYKNSLGYFIFERDSPPTSPDDIDHVLVMPNASKTDSGGSLDTGDQVDLLVNLVAGQSIGFFINSNGWDWSYGHQREDFVFGQPFYTLPSLNPTVGLGPRYHVVFNDTRSIGVADSGFFSYGFEDILTAYGDKDFNDLIFNVEVTPLSAVLGYEDAVILPSVSEQIEIKEGVLAFEDSWPLIDDYDFNDAVLGYEITKQYDFDYNNETIKSLTFDYEIQAIGATFHNGIAVRVPGLTEAMIDNVSLEKTLDGVSNTLTVASTVERVMGNGDVVSYSYPLIKDSHPSDSAVSFTLSEDLFEELSTFDSSSKVFEIYDCMFQTSNEPSRCPEGTEAARITLTINLKSGQLLSDDVGDMPFDHYIFGSHNNDLYRYRRNKGASGWFSAWKDHYSLRDSAAGPGPGKYLEIHLKEFSSGTATFEPDFSVDSYTDAVAIDAQDYNEGNPFISAEITRDGRLTGNVPWVLDLPVNWRHPKERVDISRAYPDFFTWAEDNSQSVNWYETNVDESLLFND